MGEPPRQPVPPSKRHGAARNAGPARAAQLPAARVGPAPAPPALDLGMIDRIRIDLSAPPPLLLLPLRLEYRVLETNAPMYVAGNIGELLGSSADVAIATIAGSGVRATTRGWRLDPVQLTLRTRREVWFRWFPDDDFALRGVAAATDLETA